MKMVLTRKVPLQILRDAQREIAGAWVSKNSLGVCYAPFLNPHRYIGSPESSHQVRHARCEREGGTRRQGTHLPERRVVIWERTAPRVFYEDNHSGMV